MFLLQLYMSIFLGKVLRSGARARGSQTKSESGGATAQFQMFILNLVNLSQIYYETQCSAQIIADGKARRLGPFAGSEFKTKNIY